jgi:putative spermidine/putrescine transport system substrate-binding protein
MTTKSRSARLGRFTALTALAAVAAITTASCSSGGNKASSSSDESGSGDTITVGMLGGTVQTGLEKCAIPQFEKSTGITVKYDAKQPAQLLAGILASKSSPPDDVMWASNAEQIRGDAAGVFVKLDQSTVPNLSRVPSDLQSGAGSGAAFATASVGIAYNTKVFAQKGWAAPTSFDDLFDAKYKGKVSIYDISLPFSQALVAWAAESAGGSISDASKGFAKLAKLKPNLYDVATTGPGMDQDFQQGNIWISTDSGARVEGMAAGGSPIAFVNPTDGGAWVINDYLDVVKNSKNTAAAAKFINYMLSEPVQDCLAANTGYTPVAGKVPSDIAKYFPTTGLHSFDWSGIESNLADWTTEWNSKVAK